VNSASINGTLYIYIYIFFKSNIALEGNIAAMKYVGGNFQKFRGNVNYKVEEDEVGGTCGTNGREEERV
jgi:hypothetical protein